MPDDTEQFFFDPSAPLSESFASLPAGFKRFLRAGFSTVAKLVREKKIQWLLQASAGDLPQPSRASARAIGRELGIPPNDVARLLSAATFCASALVNQKAITPGEFVTVGVRSAVVEEHDEADVRRFAEAVAAARSSIADAVERNRLSGALLPQLTSLRMAIDLRPAFTEDGTAVRFAVPVILAQIENDSTDDVWLQMSKTQVEGVVADLQDVLRRVEVLESWAAGQPCESGESAE